MTTAQPHWARSLSLAARQRTQSIRRSSRRERTKVLSDERSFGTRCSGSVEAEERRDAVEASEDIIDLWVFVVGVDEERCMGIVI